MKPNHHTDNEFMEMNGKYIVAEGYESLFDFDEVNQIELDALWIAAQFLSKIQEVMSQQKMTRKELATKIGTSASWLTQVFRGDKLPSLETIVKLQRALNIEFDISLKDGSVPVYYAEEEENEAPIVPQTPFQSIWKDPNWSKADYENFDNNLNGVSSKPKITECSAA